MPDFRPITGRPMPHETCNVCSTWAKQRCQECMMTLCQKHADLHTLKDCANQVHSDIAFNGPHRAILAKYHNIMARVEEVERREATEQRPVILRFQLYSGLVTVFLIGKGDDDRWLEHVGQSSLTVHGNITNQSLAGFIIASHLPLWQEAAAAWVRACEQGTSAFPFAIEFETSRPFYGDWEKKAYVKGAER